MIIDNSNIFKKTSFELHKPGITGQLEKLDNEERELLYRAPVLLSILASCTFNEINRSQKADAIKLAHLRTFTSDPILRPYYAEVEKQFALFFDAESKKYFPFDEAKQNILKRKIEYINTLIGKLDKDYAQALHKSLKNYSDHVKRSAHSVFQDFIFPLPIPGLTD